MFRRKYIRYFRVSNRLAILAGLILAVTALVGLPGSDMSSMPADGAASSVSQSADVRPDDEGVGAKSRWKVRFLLFTHG